MDSSISVQSSNAQVTSGGPKKNAIRRGSNPSNLNNTTNGAESGITSPRGEFVGEQSSQSQGGKRRPSVSGGPPKPPNRNASSNTVVDPKNVSLFAHLPQVTISSTSPISSITSQLLKNGKEASIHPAIIKLGLAFAEYRIMGAAERCRQMLLAFKKVN